MALIARLKLLVVAVASICLLACPPTQSFLIFNNTGEDLVVKLAKREIPWAVSKTLSLDLDEVDWITSSKRGVEMPAVTVVRAGREFRYWLLRSPLTTEYVESGGGAMVLRMQLEANGELVALKANQSFPAPHIPAQPAGFPISPELLEPASR